MNRIEKLEDINALAAKEAERRQKEKEEAQKAKAEKCARINLLPTEFEIGIELLDKEGFKFVRNESFYNPTALDKIQINVTFYHYNESLYWLLPFHRTVKEASFKRVIKKELGAEKAKLLPKNTFDILVEREKEIKHLIETA